MAKQNVSDLQTRMTMDTSQAKKSADEFAKDLDNRLKKQKFSKQQNLKSIGGIGESFAGGQFSKGISGISSFGLGTGIGLAATGVGLALGIALALKQAFSSLISAAEKLDNELIKISERLGIANAELTAGRATFRQAGLGGSEFDAIATTIRELQRGAAGLPGGPEFNRLQRLEALGVNTSGSPLQVLASAADALASTNNILRQNAIAGALGLSATQRQAILSGQLTGSGLLQNQISANRFALSDQQTREIADLTTRWDQVTTTWQQVGAQFLTKLTPALLDAVSKLGDAAILIGEFSKNVPDTAVLTQNLGHGITPTSLLGSLLFGGTLAATIPGFENQSITGAGGGPGGNRFGSPTFTTFAGAAEAGSVEAVSAILRAQFDPAQREAALLNEKVAETNQTLQAILNAIQQRGFGEAGLGVLQVLGLS